MARPRKGSRVLDRTAVLAEALVMLNHTGLEAVNSRALAGCLDVATMAIKHDVGTREQMFSGLVAQVFQGVGDPVGAPTR